MDKIRVKVLVNLLDPAGLDVSFVRLFDSPSASAVVLAIDEFVRGLATAVDSDPDAD